MIYRCRDCSHTTEKAVRGKCPACGSFNIQSEGDSPKKRRTAKQKKTLVEYFILTLFWGFLLWGIWDRYLK